MSIYSNPDMQIIDNQLIIIKKLSEISEQLVKLTNTIIKYDNEYQQEIVDSISKS